MNASKLENTNLKRLLLESGAGTLQDSINFNSFLPGQLEGNIIPQKIPLEISKIIEDNLNIKSLSLESINVLINSSQHWLLDEKYLKLTANLLRDTKHQISKTKNHDQIIYLINGLARVAAITRSTDIAKELRVLTRRYRNYLTSDLHNNELLATGLVAAAAWEDFDEWLNYIGEWITEIAFLPLTNKDASNLYAWLNQLLLLEPTLYCSCGKAIAALESLIEK